MCAETEGKRTRKTTDRILIIVTRDTRTRCRAYLFFFRRISFRFVLSRQLVDTKRIVLNVKYTYVYTVLTAVSSQRFYTVRARVYKTGRIRI